MLNCIIERVFIHAWVGMCSHAECVSMVSAGPVMDTNVCLISLLVFSVFILLPISSHAHIRIRCVFIVSYGSEYGSHIYSSLVFVRVCSFNGSVHTAYTHTHIQTLLRFYFRISFYRIRNGKNEHSAVSNWIEMIFFINPWIVKHFFSAFFRGNC